MDSAILDAFFEECEDLLTALADGLTDMLNGATDAETVNAVFRSVHSIKGAAGAFSMEALVAFAHTFETVLDSVRSGNLAPDEDLLRVLQRAGDILSDLVDAERDGGTVDPARTAPVLSELQELLGDQPVEDEAFSFDALTLDFGAEGDRDDFHVRFSPTAAFYAAGHDPLFLIQALGQIADIEVTSDISDLPESMRDFDLGKGYLAWDVIVPGQSSDLAIREVFEFVDDICGLEIRRITKADVPQDVREAPTNDDVLTPQEGVATKDGNSPPENQVSVQTEETSASGRPSQGAADRSHKKAVTSLRVDPERVDRLINAVGELIINQSVISQRIHEAALPSSSDLFSDLDDYKLLAREIQEGVMAIRAQPVRPLFQRMLRIAREAADVTGKSISIVTEGEGTEVDKTVVERLADPLTHMIRNAIDHGLEKPDVRIAAGKPETGTLRLAASQKSGNIVIEVSDDGAGLNRPRIRDIAIERGLIPPEAQLSEQEIDHLLFAPGFSTAAQVTNLSGRGVGMDVVKTAIVELGGKIGISSIAGQGTSFTISLPLTLAVMDGMVINVCGQTMVVPITSILETVRPAAADLAKIGIDGNLLRIRGEYVPIVDLGARLGHPGYDTPLTEKVLLLIQTEAVTQCALAVDEIFDQRQIVVKSMQGNYGEIDGISGATILGDGKIALIVDPDAIAGPGPLSLGETAVTSLSKQELKRAG
jgi:two-component system chemotaxis sensor kinase CheA